jgi:hypothetical protein
VGPGRDAEPSPGVGAKAKKARDNILHQRPQIDELLEAAKQWFAALEQE